MRTDHRIHLTVIFIPEAGEWVAQALQHDFAAQGPTREAALRALVHTIASHLYIALRQKNDQRADPLSDVPAAPPEYWDMFERAALHSTKATELEAQGVPAFIIHAIADQDMHVSR